jgi:hypothetical protein
MTNHVMPNPHHLRMPGTATAMLMPWREPAPDPPAHRPEPKRPLLSRPIARPHTTKEISA